MSSLARRSLRTTLAAAGIAALGVGLAGHASAAPELPALPAADGLGGAGLPTAPSVPAMPALPSIPDAPTAQDLEASSVSPEGVFVPGWANIEAPTMTSNTAAPELPAGDAFAVPTAPNFAAPEFAAPAAPALPGAPSYDGDLETEGGLNQFSTPSSDGLAQNQESAMAALDMAQFAMGLMQGAAAGDSVTENQQIG